MALRPQDPFGKLQCPLDMGELNTIEQAHRQEYSAASHAMTADRPAKR